MDFYYHALGADVGELVVSRRIGGNADFLDEVFRITDSMGDNWFRVTRTVTLQDSNDRVWV